MSIQVNEMPKLGFGLMRLPEKNGVIDHEQVCRMVDAYLEAGLNYFDTAYVYHSGLSEVEAREALVKRHPRESFMLATKLPGWELRAPEDIERIFQEQLTRAGVEYFDFYLLHSLEEGNNYEVMERFDAWNWGLRKKEAGQIRHFGFSFHGSPELLEQILDKHPEVEFVQIQLNYADMTNPVVRSGRLYDILHKRNIPIIIMEPVRGGMLANLPPEMEQVYKDIHPDRSAASWALRYVGSLDGVMTILSGMSDEEQMADNLKTFTHFEPLSEEEQAAVAKVTEMLLDTPQIGCTACKYCCDGCPMKISIPDVFRTINTLRRYPDDWRSKNFYEGLTQRSGKASDCIGCRQCEGVCPQHLPIVDLLKEAAEVLGK